VLVERALGGRSAAHVAKELGISRQCVYRWVRRYRAEGEAGLSDRSSRPHSKPSLTSPEREAAVPEARTRLRTGPARIVADTGVPARTVSRVLARHHIPALWECNALT
jgi:transposase